MALDLLAIISAAGTGAVTGYLTNNLALKMIFKEYGPLGGVVIKTKDEFIDSISALVERDLINHHTLEAEFSQPEFKESFNQSVDDFLNIYLGRRSSELKLGELPHWKENFELFSSLGSEMAVELLAAGSRELKEEELTLLVSQSRQQQLLQEVMSRVIKKAEAEASAENLIINFYQQLKSKKLKQLLNQESQLKFKAFVKKLVQYFKDNYQSLEIKEQEDFKAKLKELFDLKDLSQNILKELKNLKVSDLIKDRDELEKILEGTELHDLLKEILVNLKIELDNLELFLDQFMTEELAALLEEEASELIYTVESDLLKFLEQEETELNDLILEAVEEEIAVSSGLKAMSRQGIYNKYQENIDQYGPPITHLKDYLKENLRSDDQKLAAGLIEKVKEVKVNKILPKIDLESITASLENSILSFYRHNENEKLIDLFSEEIFAEEILTDNIVEFIFSALEKISSDQESIELLVDYLMGLKLEDLLGEDELALKKDKIAAKIYQLLSEQKVVAAEGADYLNQNFFKLLNGELKNSKSNLEKEMQNIIDQQQKPLAEKEITSLYTIFQDDPTAVANLTESITTFFYNNLPSLLEGKVAQAAAANLHQLSDQEVQTAIEDFMGQELKPITYLGALLGAVAGIVFSFSGAETAIFNASPLWIDYLSSALLYGGVGWLTNVLAIWMIFHPYQEKNILGAKVPFTPGVVAKNRSRFADSMGKFVEQELLKANSAAEIIEKNRSEIKDRIQEYFKENDYQQFFKLLPEKSEQLAETFLKKLNQLLEELKADDLKEFIESSNPALNKLLLEKITTIDFGAAVDKYLAQADKALENYGNLITSNLSMEQLTETAAGEYQFELNSRQFKQIMQNKELYPLFKFLAPSLLEKEFKFDLKNYFLNLLEQDSDYYLDQSLKLFFEQQDRIARLINFKKDEIIEQEKEKKGGLLKNTMISGAIYMADLDEFVDAVVERVFNKLETDYFVDNRDKLEKLYSDSLEQMEDKGLSTVENLNLNQLLKNFINTEAGSELLTEVIYLSDESLAEMIELLFRAENKELLSLDFEIKVEAVEYLINQQLDLEQKLKLLLLFKDLLKADNIKKEIRQLLENVDLEILNQEIGILLRDLQLIDKQTIDAELLAEIKENLISVLEKQEINELLFHKSAAEISKISKVLEQEMDRESLEYLLALFIEAGIDSFKANSESLLKSLELKELTAAEVRKMNPAEIEEVFDSFAGKYFAHLKQYGWFGGIFGVLQLLLRTII